MAEQNSSTSASQTQHRTVVAAVIQRDQRVLICQRPEGKNHGGLWEFPGGKIDPGESIPEAVVRELAEELAIETARVGEVLFSRVDEKSGLEILFLPVSITGEPIAIEHSAIVWCKPEDLLSYPLAPSDHAFVTFFFGAA